MKKQNTVKCPYCGFVFIPDENDIEYVDKIATYWCKNEKCQEQFVEDMKINNYSNYSKKEWN